MATAWQSVPVEDRPREKLLRKGAQHLTDVELLAILLRTGRPGRSVMEMAEDLLKACEQREPGVGIRCLLHLRDAELDELAPGIGKAKLCGVLAGLQLGQRFATTPVNRPELGNPAKVAEFVVSYANSHKHAFDAGDWSLREQFIVILLNAKNQLIYVESISVGSLTAAIVHPREVFKDAVRLSAHAVILAHNHPSGDPTPSREDRDLTLRLIQAGRVLGIDVLDHVVVGHGGRYVSFRERGLVEWQ